MRRSLVVAMDRNRVIGRDNALPWRLPDDLAYFKRVTMGHPVIMGRRTWESIGRALPGRRSVVVTRDPAYAAPGAETAPSLDAALERLAGSDRVYVVGGGELYRAALPLADELVLTEIDEDLAADTFFPAWNRAEFRQTSRESHRSAEGLPYSIVHYRRIPQGD